MPEAKEPTAAEHEGRISLLSEDADDPSLFLLVDSVIEGGQGETPGKIMSPYPLHTYRRGEWGRVSIPTLFLKRNRYDFKLPRLIRSGRGLMSVLLNSPGGATEPANGMMMALRAFRDLPGWTTQSVFLEAHSGAADLAVAAERCSATDEASVLFHRTDSLVGVLEDDTSLLHESPYESLNRLQRLARDRVAFTRAGFERRFLEAFDRPMESHKSVVLSGKELREATVLSAQRTTAQDIADAIHQVLQTNPPAALADRLSAFSERARVMERIASL